MTPSVSVCDFGGGGGGGGRRRAQYSENWAPVLLHFSYVRPLRLD